MSTWSDAPPASRVPVERLRALGALAGSAHSAGATVTLDQRRIFIFPRAPGSSSACACW
jgi:hypothetical protein